MSKACAKSESGEKVLYFIEEKLIQIIAELIKKEGVGGGGVRFFYSLLKIGNMAGFSEVILPRLRLSVLQPNCRFQMDIARVYKG